MRNPLTRKTLAVFLSAVTLAWGTAPPGMQHAHMGGGDATHHHGDGHHVAHHAEHDHDLDGEHHEHSTVCDVRALADVDRHIHLRWLGMELTQPVPVEPAESSGADEIPAVIVRATDGIVLTTGAGPLLNRALLAGVCAFSVDSVADLTPVPRPRVSVSIPLSDSARFERSGVLLS